MADLKARVQVKADDRFSAPVKKMRRSTEGLSGTLRKTQRSSPFTKLRAGATRFRKSMSRLKGPLLSLGRGMARIAKRGALVGAALTAAAVGGIAVFTKSGLKATADLQNFRLQLEQITGDSTKAQESLKWMERFSDNPIDLEQSRKSFLLLADLLGEGRAREAMQAIGDTATRLGKDFSSVSSAVVAAQRGRLTGLADIGLKTETIGKKIRITYQKNGEEFTEMLSANNKAALADRALQILAEKNSGAMAEVGTSITNAWDTIINKFRKFQVKIFESGVFDRLAGKLTETLDQITEWENDGTLQRWADKIAGAYDTAFDKIGEAFVYVRDNWPRIKKSLLETWETSKDAAIALGKVASTVMDLFAAAKRAFGGTENLTYALLGLGAAKQVAGLAAMVSGIGGITSGLGVATTAATGLRTALMFGGVGAAIGAVAFAFIELNKHISDTDFSLKKLTNSANEAKGAAAEQQRAEVDAAWQERDRKSRESPIKMPRLSASARMRARKTLEAQAPGRKIVETNTKETRTETNTRETKVQKDDTVARAQLEETRKAARENAREQRSTRMAIDRLGRRTNRRDVPLGPAFAGSF